MVITPHLAVRALSMASPLLLAGVVGAQGFGGDQVISTALDGAFSVHATDLDGDGDQDVLSASVEDDKIAWYENLTVSGGPVLFCNPANAHSGGAFVTLGNSGFFVLTGLYHLEASNGPDNQFGYFLLSAGFNDPGVPVSQGRLCLPSPIGRYSPAAGGVLNSIGRFDVGGVFQSLSGNSSVGSGFDVPSTLPNPPGGVIGAGDTWHFQLWYRDGVGSNFSDGISVTF